MVSFMERIIITIVSRKQVCFNSLAQIRRLVVAPELFYVFTICQLFGGTTMYTMILLKSVAVRTLQAA